ncbi:MAG: DNA mismatch repair endonuclease MutL, partial [Candidatus Hodarchaeales archaeon]
MSNEFTPKIDKQSTPAKIRRLSNDLINRIAAGEVVERPSSVVKELIENSIDAGADRITIEIENGGKKLIRVSDNGTGMIKEDVLLCLERHSTSKISSDEDLEKVISLGFRGEFLASVSAVSKVTVKSKRHTSRVGTLLKATPTVDKLQKSVSDFQMNTGTIIEVLDLFFNVPVRAKYLKTTKTELARVTDIIRSFILSHEKVTFSFKSDDKLVYQAGLSSGKRDRLALVLGKELAKRMLDVEHESTGWKIRGFVSKPVDCRRSKDQIFTFLNGRRVKNKLFISAIEDAYHSLLFKNEFPIAILYLLTDPVNYDPNVHPTKREVRIYDELKLMKAMRDALHAPLMKARIVKEEKKTTTKPLGSFNRQTTAVKSKLPLIDSRSSTIQITKYLSTPKKSANDSIIKHKQTGRTLLEIDQLLDKEAIKSLDIIGQHLEVYIIASLNDDMYIIDQHAADERINYEIILKNILNEKTQSQKLLQPIIINLTASEVETAISFKNKLLDVGFEIEQFGVDTLKIISMPVVKGKGEPKEIIVDLINKIEELKLPRDEFAEHVAVTIACHKSYRGGDYLTEPAMKKLLQRLSEADMPFTCPHGRPTII